MTITLIVSPTVIIAGTSALTAVFGDIAYTRDDEQRSPIPRTAAASASLTGQHRQAVGVRNEQSSEFSPSSAIRT